MVPADSSKLPEEAYFDGGSTNDFHVVYQGSLLSLIVQRRGKMNL